MKRRDMRYIISALQALKPMIHMRVNELDRNEFLLNTPSATYDLERESAEERPTTPRTLLRNARLLIQVNWEGKSGTRPFVNSSARTKASSGMRSRYVA